MAIVNATAIWEVQNGGSDTTCTGGFDPGVTMPLTDLACTTGTTGSATTSITSASNPWIASDTGSWIFIKSGTSWRPGWYPFTYVGAGSGTIDTRAGKWVPYNTATASADGCGSAASLTGGNFTMDYSQQAAQAQAWTATLRINLTAITDSGAGFRPTLVGNLICANTTFTTITAYTNTSTMVGISQTDTGAAQNGYLGGAFATIGFAGGKMIASNRLWIKYHATPYSAASTTSNIATGRFTAPSSGSNFIRGYDAVRGDETTNRPTFKWGVNAANNYLFDLGTGSCSVENMILDGDRATYTGTRGITQVQARRTYRIKFMNFAGTPLIAGSSNHDVDYCEFTNNASYADFTGGSLVAVGCYFHDNAADALRVSNGQHAIISCIFDTNAGDGININGSGTNFMAVNCVFYGHTGTKSGVNLAGLVNTGQFINCVFESNTAYGMATSGSVNVGVTMQNCAFYNNTTAKYVAADLTWYNIVSEIIPTGTVFTDAANADFRLNNTTGAGALLRGTGFPQAYPGL